MHKIRNNFFFPKNCYLLFESSISSIKAFEKRFKTPAPKKKDNHLRLPKKRERFSLFRYFFAIDSFQIPQMTKTTSTWLLLLLIRFTFVLYLSPLETIFVTFFKKICDTFFKKIFEEAKKPEGRLPVKIEEKRGERKNAERKSCHFKHLSRKITKQRVKDSIFVRLKNFPICKKWSCLIKTKLQSF